MENHEKNMPNDHEISRKRKNSHDFENPPRIFSSDPDENDNDYLTLSLSFCPSRPTKLSLAPPPPLPSVPLVPSLIPQPPPPQYHHLSTTTQNYFTAPPSPLSIVSRPALVGPSRSTTRPRRNPSQSPREGKSGTVPAPYPWAKNQRATVHSINHLLSEKIYTIKGEVQCKRCEKQYEMEYDLREMFVEVGTFIAENKSAMHDRAPSVWMNPVLPTCKFCVQENSVKPVIAEKKKSINWLFLLLGQMLGCCTLEQLKYFCKHTKNHRTGAKDRVLYLTYLGLCKQLDPTGPFDR